MQDSVGGLCFSVCSLVLSRFAPVKKNYMMAEDADSSTQQQWGGVDQDGPVACIVFTQLMTKRGDKCFVVAKLSPRNLQVTCDRQCKQRCEVNTGKTHLNRHEK